jgi:hypothetical protein
MGERRMKKIVTVEYSKLGGEGYYAFIELASGHIEEFFSEDWKILCDRVLFFVVDLISE